MRFHAECTECLFRQRFDRAKDVSDQRLRVEYAKELMRVISEADCERDSAPTVGSRLMEIQRRMLGTGDDYSAENARFNGLLMNLYAGLKERVDAAEDSLYAALQYSLAGNYVDFGALPDVSEEKLRQMLEDASDIALDKEEYARMRTELEGARELVFLHDNCGEIVMDKLLIACIRERYPDLRVVSLLRGTPILNDATVEDALSIGLDEVSEVVSNGLRDVAGTELESMPEALRRRVESADLIIAKGQGNFETLIGCGLNVYYLLLAKCEGYQRWFGLKQYSAVLANEARMEYKC